MIICHHLPGVENIKYNTNLDGPGAGAAVDIQLTSDDFESLVTASDELANMLRGYPSLVGVENTYSAGKQQLNYQICPKEEVWVLRVVMLLVS